ncbi:hypothetical protein [Lysobacter sp. A421]
MKNAIAIVSFLSSMNCAPIVDDEHFQALPSRVDGIVKARLNCLAELNGGAIYRLHVARIKDDEF